MDLEGSLNVRLVSYRVMEVDENLMSNLMNISIDNINTFQLTEDIVPIRSLSKNEIKSLPTVNITQEHIESGLQCTICIDNLNLGEKVKLLPCNHYYHEKCITPWLKKQAICPNCRKQIKIKSSQKFSNSENFQTDLSEFFTTSINLVRFRY